MTAAYEAVENIRALDRRDALALADEIVDDVIAALQRDRNLTPHSFTEWSLTLADLRARGLPLVYSTAVVRPDLVLTVEPKAQDVRSLLDEVLAPFDLEAHR